MTNSNQEAKMMETGDTVEYTHMWPNRTVYYTFGQTLGELLETLLIIINYLAPSASCLMILDYYLCGGYILILYSWKLVVAQ